MRKDDMDELAEKVAEAIAGSTFSGRIADSVVGSIRDTIKVIAAEEVAAAVGDHEVRCKRERDEIAAAVAAQVAMDNKRMLFYAKLAAAFMAVLGVADVAKFTNILSTLGLQ